MHHPHLRITLVPWDDREFVQAFERARAAVPEPSIHGPEAAARVEGLLRAAGYPEATIEVHRTVEEAVVHDAEWTVRRDAQ